MTFSLPVPASACASASITAFESLMFLISLLRARFVAACCPLERRLLLAGLPVFTSFPLTGPTVFELRRRFFADPDPDPCTTSNSAFVPTTAAFPLSASGTYRSTGFGCLDECREAADFGVWVCRALDVLPIDSPLLVPARGISETGRTEEEGEAEGDGWLGAGVGVEVGSW